MVLRDNNYFQVSAWMSRRLKLSGNELLCYAVIYGFSQDSESMFMGSLKYLQEWINATKPTVLKALGGLMSKGLIEKVEVVKNNVKYCYYKATEKSFDDSLQGGKDSLPGSKDTLPNNNKYNNNRKNKTIVLSKSSGETSFLEHVENEKELKYLEWARKEYPHIMAIQTPLSYNDFCKLRKEYGEELLLGVMDNLDNDKKYSKKYFNAYRAINNWCKREVKRV